MTKAEDREHAKIIDLLTVKAEQDSAVTSLVNDLAHRLAFCVEPADWEAKLVDLDDEDAQTVRKRANEILEARARPTKPLIDHEERS